LSLYGSHFLSEKGKFPICWAAPTPVMRFS